MKILAALVLATVASLVMGVALLWLRSPGTPLPLRGADGRPIPGSLSERVTLNIGGVPQGMFIQSVNPANPVLLFLHGGPGMPELFLNATHPSGLEQDFTVVWWEQRGAGISWSAGLDPHSLTVGQLIDDTIEVADHLRSRFGQDRILLVGHSWGSFLGIQVAARAPDRFLGYVGMAQVVHQLKSEVEARNAMIAAYRARGDTRMVRALDAAPVTMENGMSDAYLALRDRATHRLGGGTTRDMTSVITGVFLPTLALPAYTMREKIDIWRAKAWSRRLLWDTVLNTDLSASVTRLEVPVHFFIGRHDLTAMPDLSRAYFETIEAPHKALHDFAHSAHGPLFEEPAKARRILREMVQAAETETPVSGGPEPRSSSPPVGSEP